MEHILISYLTALFPECLSSLGNVKCILTYGRVSGILVGRLENSMLYVSTATDAELRRNSLRVAQLILSQGLVNPMRVSNNEVPN